MYFLMPIPYVFNLNFHNTRYFNNIIIIIFIITTVYNQFFRIYFIKSKFTDIIRSTQVSHEKKISFYSELEELNEIIFSNTFKKTIDGAILI